MAAYHQLTPEAIKAFKEGEFEFDHELCGQFGRGIHKSLVVRVQPFGTGITFVVKNQRVDVYASQSFDLAVEQYNSITKS